MFNLEAKRKWDSWAELGHLSKEAAMQEYVAKVIELMPSLTSTAQKPVAAKSAFGLSVSRPAMQEETAEEDSQLLKLIKSGDSDGLTKYLAVKSVDLDILDSEGLAPIHWAADRGFSDVLEVLLKFKANVDLTDAQDQQTALHYVSLGFRLWISLTDSFSYSRLLAAVIMSVSKFYFK